MSDIKIKSCSPEDGSGIRDCIVEYNGKEYLQKVDGSGKCIESLKNMENPEEARRVKNAIESKVKDFLDTKEE